MANALTANYEFTLPEVGAAANNWGGLLNANWTALDTLAKSLADDTADRVEIADIATAAQIHAGTTGKVIDAEGIYDAAAPVETSGSGTYTINLTTGGRNFIRVMNGATTLANPTGQVVGQSGLIYLNQDATGGRVVSYGSDWKQVGGTASIDLSPNAVNVFSYFVRAANKVTLTYIGAEG